MYEFFSKKSISILNTVAQKKKFLEMKEHPLAQTRSWPMLTRKKADVKSDDEEGFEKEPYGPEKES